MEYRRLGNSGLKVSIAGLGCNNFGGRLESATTHAIIHRALDEGVNFFDVADMYGNFKAEVELGAALAKRREEAIIATKFSYPSGEGPLRRGTSRRYIYQACEASLRRLNTDYIDLYQLHFPDRDTPMQETLRALDDLVSAGKVRYIGCSNLSAWELTDSLLVARQHDYVEFISAQNPYNLLRRELERELIPACEHFGVSLLPYFPLASGMLTGKYKRGVEPPQTIRMATWPQALKPQMTDDNFTRIERLTEFARQRGHSLIELAVNWLLAKPVVACVIAGATSIEQVAENTKAVGWKLTPEEMAELDKLCVV